MNYLKGIIAIAALAAGTAGAAAQVSARMDAGTNSAVIGTIINFAPDAYSAVEPLRVTFPVPGRYEILQTNYFTCGTGGSTVGVRAHFGTPVSIQVAMPSQAFAANWDIAAEHDPKETQLFVMRCDSALLVFKVTVTVTDTNASFVPVVIPQQSASIEPGSSVHVRKLPD